VGDVKLDLFVIPVEFADGSFAKARAEGNNAAWHCFCGEKLPLLGRCYFQYGHDCHTICPACSRRYEVRKDAQKRAKRVMEMT
jgi:hypothetical protein